MDGDGPGSAGHSRHMGLVLAGKDAVAIDAVLASLVSLDSETVPTTRIAAKKGLGISDLAKIEILGEDLEKSRISNFRLPKTNLLNKIPKIIFDAVAPFVYFRPAIKSAACKQCTVCAVNCPEKAIQMTKKGAKIDYRKCILCFCCHETCPYQAIYLKSSLLMKIMGM
jgi:Pyruvate/2-oxoacid:ferredoxin oxidoreductase delta subunit